MVHLLTFLAVFATRLSRLRRRTGLFHTRDRHAEGDGGRAGERVLVALLVVVVSDCEPRRRRGLRHRHRRLERREASPGEQQSRPAGEAHLTAVQPRVNDDPSTGKRWKDRAAK